MYYHQFVYVKSGNLQHVWLASHMIRKLTSAEIRNINISFTVDAMKDQKQPLALRLCGQLLLGLARIYEMKVRQSCEEAEGVLKKIHAMIGEGTKRATTRARRNEREGDDESVVHKEALRADPRKLRASHGAITAHVEGARGGDVLANLGDEYIDLDIDHLLDNPNGMLGIELQHAVDGMRQPDLTIDLENQSASLQLNGAGMQLTQASTPLGAYPESVADPPLGGDDNALGTLDGDERFGLDVDMVEGGRDADVTAATDRSLGRTPRKGDPQGGLDLDVDLGGQGGFDDQGDQLSLAEGGRDASVAAATDPGLDDSEVGVNRRGKKQQREEEEDEEDIDRKIAAVQRDMEQSKRRAKEQKREGKRQRSAAAYQPIVDEVTELSSATLQGWLKDTSDIVLRERTPAHAQRISYAESQISLWRRTLSAATRLPGLSYRAGEKASEAASVAAASEHEREVGVDDVDPSMDVFGDIELGGQGGIDFGGGGETQMPLTAGEDQPQQRTEDDEAAAAAVDDERLQQDMQLFGGAGGFGSLGASATAAEADEADVRRFFGDNRKGSSAGPGREAHESGWSRRTKQYHAVLSTAFKALPARVKELSLEELLATHARGPAGEPRSRATAAAALFQTLVLASSGFVRASQEDGLGFGDVRLQKTNTFDSKKLPQVPASGSNEDASASASEKLTQSSVEY